MIEREREREMEDNCCISIDTAKNDIGQIVLFEKKAQKMNSYVMSVFVMSQ